MASSRVGAITRAIGFTGRSKRSAPFSRVEAMPRPKATVLPEPVWAETSMSAFGWSGFWSASITASWTEVGSA